MSNLPIPIDSDIKIQVRQAEEIVQQLKRIADALEVSNGTNQAWIETNIRWHTEGTAYDERSHAMHSEWIEWQKQQKIEETEFVERHKREDVERLERWKEEDRSKIEKFISNLPIIPVSSDPTLPTGTIRMGNSTLTGVKAVEE